MTVRALLLAVSVVFMAATARANEAPPEPQVKSERDLVEDGYVLRLSLPTEADADAWMEPGFLVQLGFSMGALRGTGAALSFPTTSFQLRPRVRIDRWWSLATTFSFSLVGGDFSGLRWSATIEPVFHPLRQLGIAVGVGYGGLNVFGGGNDFGEFTGQETITNGAHISPCAGGALSTLMRADYLFVVGPLFATGPFVTAEGQWTRCEIYGGNDNETGLRHTRRQWWSQVGGSAGWWLTWR